MTLLVTRGIVRVVIDAVLPAKVECEIFRVIESRMNTSDSHHAVPCAPNAEKFWSVGARVVRPDTQLLRRKIFFLYA